MANEVPLDPQVEEQIKTLLSKDPSEFTQNDKVILRARVSYLGKKARQKFADILDPKKDVKQQVQADDPNNPPVAPSSHPADKNSEKKDESSQKDASNSDASDGEDEA